jgi:hypothetical protein
MPIEYYKDDRSFRKYNNITTDLLFLQQSLRRLQKGFSVFIVICGSQRAGKSFLAVWLWMIFRSYFKKDYTDPTKCVIYDPIDITKRIKNDNNESYILDEASDLLNAQEWYLKSHQCIKSLVNTQTYKKFVLINVSPFVSDIDKSIRKHFDFMIRVDGKGDYRAFKFVKKYDSDTHEKSKYKLFMDYFGLRKKSIPRKIWNAYEEFSFEQKEKIRQMRQDQMENMIKKTKDEILLESIRGDN